MLSLPLLWTKIRDVHEKRAWTALFFQKPLQAASKTLFHAAGGGFRLFYQYFLDRRPAIRNDLNKIDTPGDRPHREGVEITLGFGLQDGFAGNIHQFDQLGI